MTREKRRLGQGLAALLGNSIDESGPDENVQSPPQTLRIHPQTAEADDHQEHDVDPEPAGAQTGIVQLAVNDVEENPFQPRREFSESEITSLAESLKEHDMLQPILVRRVEDRYQLISGERRLRAAIQAGWATVPARVREADDRLVAELAIVENLQRKDLNPLEKALSFRRYLDEHRSSQEELAQRLKIDRSTIANLLRLLELPAEVQDALRQGKVSAGHARALLPLGDEWQQNEFCRRIVDEGLSVRATEQLVGDRIREEDGEQPLADSVSSKRKKRAPSEQIVALEQQLRVALGTKVEIRCSARGRGRIVIHFSNHDEFERIHDHLIDGPDDELREAG